MKGFDISQMETVNVSLGRWVGVESKDNYRHEKYLYVWLQILKSVPRIDSAGIINTHYL